MNTELKVLLGLIFGAVKIEQDIAGKENILLMLPDLLAIVEQIPGAVSNWSDLLNEVKALSGPAQQADLLNYIQGNLKTVISSAKAQAIVAAVVKLVEDAAADVVALQQAIVS